MDQLNWTIPYGDNWIGGDIYADDAQTPYPLVGATVKLVLKHNATDSAVLLDASQYVTVNQETCQINWDVPFANVLADLPFPLGNPVDIDGRGTLAYNVAHWALTIVWPAGNDSTILSGNLLFIPV